MLKGFYKKKKLKHNKYPNKAMDRHKNKSLTIKILNNQEKSKIKAILNIA